MKLFKMRVLMQIVLFCFLIGHGLSAQEITEESLLKLYKGTYKREPFTSKRILQLSNQGYNRKNTPRCQWQMCQNNSDCVIVLPDSYPGWVPVNALFAKEMYGSFRIPDLIYDGPPRPGLMEEPPLSDILKSVCLSGRCQFEEKELRTRSPRSNFCRSEERARSLTVSCENGNGEDCAKAAELEEWMGHPQVAANLYRQACHQGVYSQCYAAAMLSDDVTEAKKMFSSACLKGWNGMGCFAVGYFESYREPAASEKWFHMAFDADKLICVTIGDHERISHNEKNAKYWYEKGCSNGDERGCGWQMIMAEQSGDLATYWKLMRASCEGSRNRPSNSFACWKLAGMAERNGQIEEAKKWLAIGCKNGGSSSCQDLERLEKKEEKGMDKTKIPLGDTPGRK